MKKLLGLLLLLMPLAAMAQSGIDGTWRLDMSKTQLDSKPRVFVLKNGMYSCSCDPGVKIKADGLEHKVTGSPYADTEIAKIMDDHTVEVVAKKGGNIAFRATMTVAPDGQSMTRKFEEHHPGDQVVTYNSVYSRVGDPEAGAHSLSGSWKRDTLEASENGRTFTYAMTGDGVNYKASDGEFYSAKFDGKDYPYHGDPGTTTVMLKKIDDHTFEETDKHNGEIVGIERVTLSPDGKSLTMVAQDKREGMTYTFFAEKQEKSEAEK